MAFMIEIEKDAASVEHGSGDAEGTLIIHVGDQSFTATADPSQANRFSIVIDGVKKTIHTAKAPNGVWVWMDGKARLVSEIKKTRGAAGGSVSTIVTPPMPGVVVRVSVAIGEIVTKGQELVVVSAMKMETSLNAPYNGTVASINTEEGQQVNPGDVLVDVDEDKNEVSDE